MGTLAKVVDVWDGLSDDGMAGFVACTGAVGGWLFDGGGVVEVLWLIDSWRCSLTDGDDGSEMVLASDGGDIEIEHAFSNISWCFTLMM